MPATLGTVRSCIRSDPLNVERQVRVHLGHAIRLTDGQVVVASRTSSSETARSAPRPFTPVISAKHVARATSRAAWGTHARKR